MTTVAALDLFSGACGGWSLGLHRAGVQTIAACEIDDWRRAVYAANNPGVALYADVRELTAARLMGDLGRLPDWIVGSPPCQDASTANTRGRGVDGERTGLFFEAVRLVAECRSRWACFENVPGLRTRGADRVLAELEALGYSCWPLVVGAVHAGSPHRRQRVWIVAADVNRAGLRQQPGWCGRQNGVGTPLAAEHVAADLPGDGRRPGRTRRPNPGVTRKQQQTFSQPAPRHPSSARLALGEGVGSDACSQLAAIERAVEPRGLEWNGGPARHLGMVDGLPSRLARACISAYGDSVLPQITEAIARAILAAERSMSA